MEYNTFQMHASHFMLLILLSVPSFAQTISTPSSFQGTLAYIEIVGPGASITANADRVIFQLGRSWNVSGRIGFGFDPVAFGERPTVSIPVGMNIFKGRHGHNREIGVHLTYNEGLEISSDGYRGYRSGRGIFFSPTVGYRYQRSSGGFFARVQYSPLVKIAEFSDNQDILRRTKSWIHLFGLSFGYFFAHRD